MGIDVDIIGHEPKTNLLILAPQLFDNFLEEIKFGSTMSKSINRVGQFKSIDRFVRVVCFAILVATACLKIALVAQEKRSLALGVGAPLVLIAAVELSLAVLLLFAPGHWFTRVGTHGLCASFLGASLVAVFAHTECACFGNLTVAPLDRLFVAASLFLGILLYGYVHSITPTWHRLLCILPIFALGGGAVQAASPHWFDRSTVSERFFYRSLPSELHFGDWSVVVVRASCPACRDFLDRMPSIHTSDAPEKGHRRALVVLGEEFPWLRSYANKFDRRFTVPDPPEIHLRTPVVFVVAGGRLVTTPTEEDRDGS